MDSEPGTSAPKSAAPKKKTARKKSQKSTLTPAMQQYAEQKAQVEDAILLFRMGDFYETFFDDAHIISRVLGLTLTARSKTTDNPIPLAGVPYHAVDSYVAKLVRAGYKVAISEQIEDPKHAKGIVKRAVQRIITPGTLTDESILEERSPNLLVGVYPENGQWDAETIGLACAEISSGRFFAQIVDRAVLTDELARIQPAEILVPEHDVDQNDTPLSDIRETLSAAITPIAAHVYDPHVARKRLFSHFRIKSLAGFGFDEFDASLCAAAAVLDYLQQTQKSALAHILKVIPRDTRNCLLVDHVTLRALEVERTLRESSREGSLLDAIDMTVNPMGARRLREWVCFPLRDGDAIQSRQDSITDLRARPDRLHRLRALLGDMADIERIVARIGVGRVSPRDMVALGRALLGHEEIRSIIESPTLSGPAGTDLLGTLVKSIGGLEELGELLTRSLVPDAPPVMREGGYIADGYNDELDRLRAVGRTGREWIAEYQARESARTAIPTLKVGFNSVFGYYIEITHQHRDKVPPEYVRKQTVRNAERYITEELKKHEDEVLGASDRAKQLEAELFEDLRQQASLQLDRLQAAADGIASLDVLASLAELSRRRDYCRPELVKDAVAVLEITDGRHPVLDVTLAERFVPNDCHLEDDADRMLIITGPNMAGKSTYIRQVALLVLLAQTGSYVPARSMRWSPADRVFARVGASDELARGHSTFMVEMVETSRILHNATARSLVVLDEIGRGTSTYDGLALAWAVTEHIADQIGCRTLFASHYHELTELADDLPRVSNCNVAVKEQLRPDGEGRDVVFLHKIVPGSADRSYGVHVAAMAGIPSGIIQRSEQILAELERSFRRKSQDSSLSAHAKAAANQLLLFEDPNSFPPEWQETIEALKAVDLDQTRPIEALTILDRLKQMIDRAD